MISSQWCSARHLRVLSKLMSCVIFCPNSCGKFHDIIVSGKWCRLSGSTNILNEILPSILVPNISCCFTYYATPSFKYGRWILFLSLNGNCWFAWDMLQNPFLCIEIIRCSFRDQSCIRTWYNILQKAFSLCRQKSEII